jgi:hypothetical protein
MKKRYKLALAILGFMMFGPGVLTILALMKYIDRVTPSELAQGDPQDDLLTL